jgi:DNA repair exonuclease SbcCD ATPase subunit
MITPEKQKIQDLRKKVDSLISKRDTLLEQKLQKEDLIKEKRIYTENLIKARWTFSQVSLLTQTKFSEYVSSMVTYALKSVYDRDLKFLVTFEINRNKMECKLQMQEGDKEPYNPEEETGGGTLDVISLALRIVLWSLKKPRSRNVLFLDEPLRFIGKGPLLKKGIIMMKEISRRLDPPLQLIINTHIPELAEMADRAWTVTHNGTHCTVKQLDSVMDANTSGIPVYKGTQTFRSSATEENLSNVPKSMNGDLPILKRRHKHV